MDSRERTFLALNREPGDRIPLDLWLSEGMEHKLKAETGLSAEALRERYDVDLRYIAGPRYIGPPLRVFPDGSSADLWGVRRRAVEVRVAGGVEHYKELVEPPLGGVATVEEIEDYPHWPSPDWFDYREIAAQCAQVRAQGRVVVFMGDRLNRIAQLKPAMYLRGIEAILEDMLLRPALAQALLGRIRRFYSEYTARILEAAQGQLDIILTGDDFGAQTGPLLSPALWHAFLGEGFSAYCALIHSAGVRVMHHTCGGVRPLIPLMIACGLDILQSLQPEAAGMESGALKADFGMQLAFQGGISIQQTLPFGTPEDVRREVRQRAEVLGVGGGYILGTSHNIQADVPLRNLTALLEAYHTYGRYR